MGSVTGCPFVVSNRYMYVQDGAACCVRLLALLHGALQRARARVPWQMKDGWQEADRSHHG